MLKGKSDFRSSKSEAENRLVGLAKSMDSIEFSDDQFVCLSCGFFHRLARGELGQLYLPMKCANCGLLYSQKFQYCVPDGILAVFGPSRFGIVFVNEDKAHGKGRVVEKDQRQIELLKSHGYESFVISDHEIYSMTNSSLKVWLYGASESLRKMNLSEALYAGEKEYRCLRPD